MLAKLRLYLPWITGLLAIGGLVAMSLMEVPAPKPSTRPAPGATAPVTALDDAASAPEVGTPVCADGATRAYSDRPCAPGAELQRIPVIITPLVPAPDVR